MARRTYRCAADTDRTKHVIVHTLSCVTLQNDCLSLPSTSLFTVEKHLAVRMFSALSCTAHSHWHEFRFISGARELTRVCQTEGDRTRLFAVPLKSRWCAFHVVQRYKHTSSQFRTQRHHVHSLFERKDLRRCCATHCTSR